MKKKIKCIEQSNSSFIKMKLFKNEIMKFERKNI